MHIFTTDIESFLFGGTCQNSQGEEQNVDSWPLLNACHKHSHTVKNITMFTGAIEYYLSRYCWDTINCCPVGMEYKYSSCQVFDMPDQKTIKEWWIKFVKERFGLQDVEFY